MPLLTAPARRPLTVLVQYRSSLKIYAPPVLPVSSQHRLFMLSLYRSIAVPTMLISMQSQYRLFKVFLNAPSSRSLIIIGCKTQIFSFAEISIYSTLNQILLQRMLLNYIYWLFGIQVLFIRIGSTRLVIM